MTDHNPGFAPSEEMTLHCDAPQCVASVSLVSGVKRSAHDWGRITLYTDSAGTDYDLCPRHHKAVLDGLWS
jgi:hypothetical protein